jgi:hypothetical protein
MKLYVTLMQLLVRNIAIVCTYKIQIYICHQFIYGNFFLSLDRQD